MKDSNKQPQKRSRNILIRVTPRELEEAKRLAENSGLTVSDLFRHKTLSTKLPQKIVGIPLTTETKLNQIGVCLDQLVRAINTARAFGHSISVDQRLLSDTQELVWETKQVILERNWLSTTKN
jgi:antitoxin component of RelBE/YafQ-DinJ toxin-antitoxin module